MECAIIGVDPDYTNTGLPCLIIDKIVKNFKKYHIEKVRFDPILTTNNQMQGLRSRTKTSIKQLRQTYVLSIEECLNVVRKVS